MRWNAAQETCWAEKTETAQMIHQFQLFRHSAAGGLNPFRQQLLLSP
jgi:hypothetical protein